MSEILPIHALKAQIIQHALDMMHSAPHNFTEATAEDVDALWDEMREDYPDTMQDAQNEVRTSGKPTGLATPHTRHLEVDAVAVLTPFNQWVGFYYWHGGGKHSGAEEIEWLKDSYWVQAETDQVLRLDLKFSSPDGKPEPYDPTELANFYQRLEAMNAFCAPVSTESMAGQNVYTWINTESKKLVEAMGEDAVAGVGPMTAFKKAFGDGPVSGVVATLFAQEFLATPAKNYFELVYNTPEMGNFTVTIQRHEGLTPGQKLAAVEADHDNVITQSDALYERVLALEAERDKLLAQLKETVDEWAKSEDVFGAMSRARQLIAKLEA